MKKPLVTVLICTYNDGKYIRRCLQAVLAQSYKNFEFVIVSDGSTDDTNKIIESFSDSRIRFIRNKKNTSSLATIRTIGLSYVRTKYVFFTDGDCAPTRTWLARGMQELTMPGVVAVEGKLVYNHEDYRPSFRDRVTQNLTGQAYMTANMGYLTSLVKKYEFRKDYDGMEDREIALRILKKYKIPFVADSVVYHQQKLWSVKTYFADAKRFIPQIFLFKNHKDRGDKLWRIVQPQMLALIFLPFLLIGPILQGRVRTWSDFALLPFAYPKAIYLRYIVWKTAIQERVFVL